MSLARFFDLQILVGVHDRQVAGLKPLTGKNIFSRLRVFQITAHQRVAAHNDFTHCFASAGSLFMSPSTIAQSSNIG